MKKFLSYVLTFVIMFMLSATGTIWLAKTANNNNNNNFVPDGGNQGGAEQTSFFSGILSTFNEHKQFNISGDIEVEYDNKDIDLSVFASVDIQDQTNIKVDALLKTQIDGRTFAVSVIYYNSTIFVSFNNVNVKAEVKNLADLGAKLLDLFPELKQKVGGADISAKMEEMLPSLMGALNNPVEETLPNGDKKNTIDFENLAVASIITDSEGMLKGADVSTYELYGIKANLSLSIAFSDSIVVENPETRLIKKNYLELSRVMNIVSNMKTWQNFETNVDLSVSSIYGDFDFGFNVLSRIKDNAFMMKMNSSSERKLENMFIKFIDNNAYVCFGDVKILISDELVNLAGNKIQDLVSKFIGTNGKFAFDDELISNLTEKAKGVNISNIFEILDKIKKLEVSNDQIVLDTEYGIVTVSLSDSKIENIVASFKYKENQISFVISFEKSEKEISAENKEEYFNIYELAKENAKFYSSSAFDIKANLELLKNSERVALLSGNVAFDFRKPYLNTNLMLDIGQEFNISAIYEGDTAYVQIDNVFVKMNKADFIKLLDEFNIQNNIEEKKQETLEKFRNELQKQFENMKFEDIKEKLDAIKEVKINASGIEVSVDLSVFGLSGIGHFVLNIENNIVSDIYLENFGFNEYVISGEIEVLSNTISEKEFDKTKYLDAYALYQNVKSLQSLNEAKASVVLSSVLEGNHVSLSANVGMNKASEYLFANGKLTLNGERYDFDVQAFEKQIYAKLQNISVKFNLDWIKELAGGMVNKEQATKMVNDLLEKLKSYLPENLQSFDVSLLQSVKDFKINTNEIYAKLDGNILGLSTDITFKIEIRNNQISSVELLNFITKEGNEVSVKANFYFTSVKPANVEKEKYLDVEKTIDKLIALKDMRQARLSAKANVIYKDMNVFSDINMAFNLDNNYYFVAGNVNYNGTPYDFDLRVYENNIFAILNNIKAKTSIDFVKELASKFGLKLNADELVSKVKDEISSKIGEMKFEFNVSMLEKIKKLNINSNTIKVVLDKNLFNLESNIDITIILQEGNILRLVLANLEIDNETQVELDLTLDLANVQINYSNENEYLDVETLLNNVLNTLESDKLNANISASLYSKDGAYYNKEYDFVVALNKQKTAYSNNMFALIEAVYQGKKISLETILQDNTIYANLNNFKVKVATDKILETVHTILQKFGKDQNQYDNIISKVIDILNCGNIKEILSDLDIDLGSGNMKEKLNISKLAESILNAQINANKIVLVLENGAIENLPELQIEIDLDNSTLSKIKIDKFEFENGAVDIEVKFDATEKQIKTLDAGEKEEYIRLDRLADLAVSTYETLKNKVISGTMHIDFIFGGEHNIVLAEYGIKYISEENRLSGYIKASFNGVTLNVFYVDSVFYVDLGGVNNNADNRLQIKAEFDELNDVLAYIKGKTGLEIDIDFNEIRDVLAGVKDIEVDFEQIRDMVFGLDLGFVESAEFGESSFEANFKGDLSIFINFKETVHQVVFKTGVVVAEINCENFNDFAFDSLDKTTYNSYTVITNAVDSVMNTLKTQPLEFFANLGVYKNSELNFNVDAGYQDEILLLNIKGMKIQIQRQKLAEILSYALSSMGIDPSIISFIGNVSDAKDLDTDNLQELVPELNLGNPFAMLKFLKGIVLKDGVFEIEIDSKLLGNENASDMKISLETANNWISSLKVSNVFVKADTALNISLVFERRINESYSNYIDLSNSADLVKAFVNTSALNEYRITGNIKLGVGSTDLKNVYVKVDARVILDENKNPIVQVDVSNYPLIGLVNGKNTNGVGGITGSTQRARTISVYYKDGQMLLKTSDEKWAAYKKYDRVTKIEPSYLINNLKYYMQWLLGFEDYIQDKINSAIDTSNANKQQASDKGELDLSNIITKYEKQGNTHLLDINIGKIAYNDDIGTLSIKLTTVNNAKTNNKDYIGYLDIDLDMLDGTIVLKTDADNKLQLENIVGGDSTVSVSTAESELADGTFVLDGEYERKGNGSFGQTNRNSVTITLDNNGGVGTTSISGSVGDRLTLLAPTKVVDNGVTRETYKFIGYYDGNGKLYTRNCFPRQNITLYARFVLEKVEEYRALVLEKNNGEENQTISKLHGSLITVDALADYVFDNGIFNTAYTFVGWSLNGEIIGKNVSITLSENTTLVAVWSEETRYYRTISFVTNNNKTMKDITKLEGETLEIVSLDDYISYDDNYKYVYTFIGWFDNSSFNGEQVKTYNFDRDLTIYAKFDLETFEIRTINIIYAGNVVHTEKVLIGEKFVAPNKEMFKDTTIYYNEDGQVLTDLTVYSNETWTIRNYFNYKVISTFGHKIGSTVEGINEVYNGYLNGETISLSKLERAMTVGAEYDTEYEFKGYRIVETGEMITLNSNEQDFVLPTFDATIEAVFENIEWCTITFNTSWSKPSGWSESRTRKIIHDSYPTAVASVRVRRGSSVDVSKFNSTCTVRYKVATISGTYDFFVWSWNYSDPDCIFNVTPNDKVNNRTKLTTITVNSNTTLYATWSATKR